MCLRLHGAEILNVAWAPDTLRRQSLTMTRDPGEMFGLELTHLKLSIVITRSKIGALN